MMMTMMDKTSLSNTHSVVILPHTMPDGDTIGSCVALFLGLKQLGKEAYIVLDDTLPKDIAFLNENILSLEAFAALGVEPDTCMSVDLSDLNRLAQRQFLTENKVLWNIDHHVTNLGFGDVKVVDIEASSTGEIIFALLKHWGVQLTQDMAEALYVAISSDTGSFKYANTTPRTHRIVAELLEVGIRRDWISLNLYHSEPPSKLKLHAMSLSQLHIYPSGHVARAFVTLEMLEMTNAHMTESDGLVERIRDIEHIDTVLLIKEISPQEIKISMRSIGDVDVSKIALAYGGGGHKNAAGFSLACTLEEALTIIDGIVGDEN